MKTTQTKPNKKNGLKGTLVKVAVIIDQFEVPAFHAIQYCEKYPGGEHGKRYAEAVRKAEEMDLQIKGEK